MGLDVPGEPRSDFDGPSLLVLFRTGLGTLLILGGLGIGLYLAKFAIDLIGGAEPPRLVAQLTSDPVQGQVELPPPNQGKAQFELSASSMKSVAYGLTFMLLLIPAGISRALLSAGAGMLDFESARVTKKLLERIRQGGA